VAPTPATAAATSAAVIWASLGSLRCGCGRGWRLFENGFLFALVHLVLGFGGLFFGKFCNDRLQSAHWLGSGFAEGYACNYGRRHRNRRAQAD